MSIKGKVHNRAGTYRIHNADGYQYESFIPAPLEPAPEIIMDREMIELMIDAEAKIKTLDQLSDFVPDMETFSRLCISREGLYSSMIEGSRSTMDEVLSGNNTADTQEVLNNIEAINFATERIKTLPISNRLIRETHAVLMHGVRGSNKSPGEFRHSQNWIGQPGSTLRTAKYIPPCVEDMTTGLNELESFVHDPSNGFPLVSAALIHYQFETIHPFLDGNGRIGRLLIGIYLLQRGTINNPVVFPSSAIKNNQAEYYDRLELVRTAGDYEGWIKFFLRCMRDSAEEAINRAKTLSDLRCEDRLTAAQCGKRAEELYDYLLDNPIIEIGATAAALGWAYNTAKATIDKLVNAGILQAVSDNKRNKQYVYESYMSIFR